ncbi:MAG TPA: ABC transporter ATP-binding protein [Oligoflexus sp.]|uniref:ABC transporter ATP-binding protein n=1 Tax=Oligoflexus sp. TaxID=1971216 RepID=UPI002D482796|nr:ABC transporter ATP-binding protein [Oligoflexus sp.]HYX39885.1 ABC transporter ATP-binding protein [Oligoflexus sp.]
MTSALKVAQLVLKVQDKTLLDRIDLDVQAGGIHLILGPNGAGKTLLLRCMAGVLQPTSGNIMLAQTNVPLPLCWTPLSSALPFAFTVQELVLMGRYPWHQGFPGKSDREAADKALLRVGMQGFAQRVYNSLSRGEQTRVDLARAIAADSPVMLFDEPFANLDIDASLHLTLLFAELAREGRTLVLSHHDLYSARSLATHLVFLKQGKLVAAGPCPEFFTPDMIRRTYDVEARIHEEQDTGEWFIRFQNVTR